MDQPRYVIDYIEHLKLWILYDNKETTIIFKSKHKIVLENKLKELTKKVEQQQLFEYL